ncbi:MAG: chorismate mutase [Candidatus Altiarchaeota archaeon]
MGSYDDEIDELRREIDELDAELLKLVEERLKIVKRIGDVKRAAGLPTEDVEREERILRNMVLKSDLDEKFVRGLFKNIIEYCKDNERQC